MAAGGSRQRSRVGRFAHLAVWDAAASRMLVWGGYLSGNMPGDTELYALDFGTSADGVKGNRCRRNRLRSVRREQG